jgi:hypothetical protein
MQLACTTPKCVLVHFGFLWILSEFGHFYHGETRQPLSEQGQLLWTMNWSINT